MMRPNDDYASDLHCCRLPAGPVAPYPRGRPDAVHPRRGAEAGARRKAEGAEAQSDRRAAEGPEPDRESAAVSQRPRRDLPEDWQPHDRERLRARRGISQPPDFCPPRRVRCLRRRQLQQLLGGGGADDVPRTRAPAAAARGRRRHPRISGRVVLRSRAGFQSRRSHVVPAAHRATWKAAPASGSGRS